jgi:hypothetical protein
MPTPEVQDMMSILSKLNEVEAMEVSPATKAQNLKNAPKPTILASVSKDAVGMLSILEKFEKATTSATKQVITESKHDVSLLSASKVNDTVAVGRYEVVLEKATVVPGIKKTFYNIKEGNETLYSQVALFETAMGIVKGLLFGNTINIDKLLDLDNRYASNLAEAAMFRVKTKTLKEGYKLDIAITKQQAAVSKMSSLKKQIKSAL